MGAVSLFMNKKWMTEDAIVKLIDEEFPNSEPRWLEDQDRLRRYAEGENPFKSAEDRSVPASAPFFLAVAQSLTCSSRDHALTMRSLFSGREDWIGPLSKAAAYTYWRISLENRSRRSALGMSLRAALESLTDCLALGWMSQAELLTREIQSLYGDRRYSDVNGTYSRPLYHWILRIALDYWRCQFDGWGHGLRGAVSDVYAAGECFGEPKLNELFDLWREPDSEPHQAKLSWLCDYYIHRTHEKEGFEFGNDLMHTRFPATILAWFRFRECLGLNNPRIEHPLMEPLYTTLLSSQKFYTEPLLDEVIARLRREELPDLGTSPRNHDEGRGPDLHKPTGWLGRFLGRCKD